MIRTASQQKTATVSRICDAAIESCSSAPTPNSASRSTDSNRSASDTASCGATSCGVAVTAASALSIRSPRIILSVLAEQTLGGSDHRLGSNAGQAAEVAMHADALITWPAV